MDRSVLRRIHDRAEISTQREIADLATYFTLTLPDGSPTESWLDALNALPEVELAAPEAMPAPAPSVPDFESLQGYLSAAPEGLDAHFAWTIPGGTGAGVAICDMEGGWNLSHEDLPPATVMVPDGETVSEVGDDEHGTEVLGTMFSLHNGWGTTGASYDSRCLVAPIYLDSGYGLFQQILWVASQLEPGDIILIEVQTAGPYIRFDGTHFGYVPVEWDPAVYNAIVTAVGNGIHVIVPAGNGSQNLDDPIYAAGNYGHAPFLPENNSGAIMVGAGVPPTAPERGPDRSRLDFSNYGSRLDLQGWGIRVATTGIGDLYSEEGKNWFFTGYFGGTSSAGPLVASAVASVEGIVEHAIGTTVPPSIMRTLLVETGTPQQDGAVPAMQEQIGPRPDLRAAHLRSSSPIISASGSTQVFEGEAVRIAVDARDLDGDPIDALTAQPLPAGATFTTDANNTLGSLEWQTQPGQNGSYLVTFTASNSAQASVATRIEIASAERGPVISGPGGVVGVEQGPLVRATLRAADPNGDPIVSFMASNLPSGAAFVTDSMNTVGMLTWRPNYDQAGQYVLLLTAVSRSEGLGGQLQIGEGMLVVTVVNHDRAPVVFAPLSVGGAEGESLSFPVEASDPDGDVIANLHAEALPPGASFSPDGSNTSGLFSWVPGYDQAGLRTVYFVAENIQGTWAATNLLIENTDRAPVVTAPATVRGSEGVELTFEAAVSDPDGDPIVGFVAVGLPPSAELSTNASRTTARFEWIPGSGEAGEYAVTLIATSHAWLQGEAALADSVTVAITVEGGEFAARVYVLPGVSPVRLGTGGDAVCAQVEAVGGNFDIAKIDLTTLTLAWPGSTAVNEIQGRAVEPQTWGDRDHNGVVDVSVWFSKEDLRRLFGAMPEPRQKVQTTVAGEIMGSGTFEGEVDLEVMSQRGLQDASVTPNPVRGASTLSFYTPSPASVRLSIFDVQGRLVGTPLDEPQYGSDFHGIALSASLDGLPTGIYYYKLETSNGSTTGRFTYLK